MPKLEEGEKFSKSDKFVIVRPAKKVDLAAYNLLMKDEENFEAHSKMEKAAKLRNGKTAIMAANKAREKATCK